MPAVLPDQWDEFLETHPDSHILQSRHWGELKNEFEWHVHRIISNIEKSPHNIKIGAQILFRDLPLNFKIAYIPKGPVGPTDEFNNWFKWKYFWTEIDELCRRMNVVFLIVEPDSYVINDFQTNNSRIQIPEKSCGFKPGIMNIQPMRTIVVEIRGTEDEILARMNQKTRYNIRLAKKKGVLVASNNDIEEFFKLMEITGKRDSFDIHSKKYYERVFELFHQQGNCELLFARYNGELLSTAMVFAQGSRSWFFYGASSNLHREMMPNYLTQWEAIRWAREHGCHEYDLWGVPDENEEVLEQFFQKRSDGLWGVYRFKRGFGGKIVRSSGPWDRVYIPGIYSIYKLWIGLKKRKENQLLV